MVTNQINLIRSLIDQVSPFGEITEERLIGDTHCQSAILRSSAGKFTVVHFRRKCQGDRIRDRTVGG
jgi:hypothetical protein